MAGSLIHQKHNQKGLAITIKELFEGESTFSCYKRFSIVSVESIALSLIQRYVREKACSLTANLYDARGNKNKMKNVKWVSISAPLIFNVRAGKM